MEDVVLLVQWGYRVYLDHQDPRVKKAYQDVMD